MKNERIGLIERLTGGKKVKKSTCCCNIEIEEIPEEEIKKGEQQKPSVKESSCCK